MRSKKTNKKVQEFIKTKSKVVKKIEWFTTESVAIYYSLLLYKFSFREAIKQVQFT